MASLVIERLEWDDENEGHILEHDDPVPIEVFEAMIAGGDWFAFPNKKGHPSHRRLVVGRGADGAMVTIVLEPPVRHPGSWRPVTGWWSTRTEVERYERERQRRG